MARVCEICGKGRVSGNQVSHSNRHSKRSWMPNLRNVKAVVNGSPSKIRVCSRCLRSGKVERPM
ncbi:50S ribosomal protein L28 [Peptoclostridium acidaminophilum DSM 3953]|uniref:Large ribosomal subunit protein bL28 n=1 Tax=Peptoclostridium acidaminophilum DSM 3953 TaxID=1286171 RepID=W8TG06_PEPAC|nr:50S ribosomal protein L28 [Peptoclostridium acidaminophilum]AHM56758.1 50S ribosomal protein L28 [Peptoclostridium acidaminophilum DSM 3953]